MADRGTVVFGFLVVLLIVLTAVLGMAVHQGATSQDALSDYLKMDYFNATHAIASNQAVETNSSQLLGSASTGSIISSWQYPYSTDIITFISSSTYVRNFDYNNKHNYYTHNENVMAADANTYFVTVFSDGDNPWGGWAFINGNLYMVQYMEYSGWLTGGKMTPLDPILGSWQQNSCYYDNPNIGPYQARVAFDGSKYITWLRFLTHESYKSSYNYVKKDNVWVEFFPNPYNDDGYRDYYLTVYIPDANEVFDDNRVVGYTFIDGTLYQLRSTFRSVYPYFTDPNLAFVPL